jgi:hypothetical protein
VPNADIEPAHSQPDPRHQFNDPLRVVAFNSLEHWAKDVSEDIAAEIQTRLDMEGNELPEPMRDFVESHRHSTRQLSLRLA